LKMPYWAVNTTNTIKFDDTDVGAMALISMYQTLTFLILQFLIFIPAIIIQLFFETQDWDRKTGEIVSTALMVLIDSVLIVILANKGKKSFEQHIESRQNPRDDTQSEFAVNFGTAITELHIETSLGVAAMIGIVWCLLLGLESNSLVILLVIVEGAALLFLSIFIIIRYLTTKLVRPTAVAILILTGFSLWSLLR